MFFFRKNSATSEEEDTIEMLILRLEHSEYTEDKIDALQQLRLRLDKNILEIGTYGINAIVESMNELLDVEDNLFILLKLLISQYKNEFAELFLKEPNNIEVLLNNSDKSKESIYELICLLSNYDKFAENLIKSKYSASYVIELIKEEKYEFIYKILNLDVNFNKQLVFEGIFEQLNVNFMQSKNTKTINIIVQLLYKSHFNQNYFIETEWYKLKEDKNFKLIVEALLDNTNNNVNYIKDNVYKYYDINLAVKNNDYKYIYHLTRSNSKYFTLLQEKFNEETVENVILECCQVEDLDLSNQIDECIIIEILCCYLLKRKQFCFKYDDFNYFLISDILEKQYENILSNIKKMSKKLQLTQTFDQNSIYNLYIVFAFKCNLTNFNFNINDLNKNTVLSFLLLADKQFIEQNHKHIVKIIYEENNDNFLRSTCVLICCINNIELKYNNFFISQILKELRKHILSKNIFIIDEALNIVVEQIGESILRLN